MYVMRRLVKGLNKVGCACFCCCFALVGHFELLELQSCFSPCGRWALPRMLGKGNPFCRECVCMHVSQRLNEAMAFIDGDRNRKKMLCEFVASRSQRVHSLRGYFQIYGQFHKKTSVVDGVW